MSHKLNLVLLIDDNHNDNFIHKRAIKKTGIVKEIVAVESGVDALKYLKARDTREVDHVDMIFLDINMPGMNGWEFLNEYDKLTIQQKAKVVIIMLSASANPTERIKAGEMETINDFQSKPLTPELFVELVEKHFPKG